MYESMYQRRSVELAVWDFSFWSMLSHRTKAAPASDHSTTEIYLASLYLAFTQETSCGLPRMEKVASRKNLGVGSPPKLGYTLRQT